MCLPALHVASKVRMDQTIFGEDFTYLKSQASTAVPKQTIPSPNMVHYRGGPAMLEPEVYPASRSSGRTWPRPTRTRCGG